MAWDTRGNAYYTCLEFKRGAGVTEDPDQSSAFYLYRSTGTNGASWNFTGRPVAEHNDVAGAGNFLLDKPLMAVDDSTTSPFRDRIYVAYTAFAADGTAYIYEAHSADYGEHFSAPVLVSTNSSLCPRPASATHPLGTCDNNQFAQPFTAPDGTVYVVFDNYNSARSGAADNHSQVLLARSADGGASFSAPVLRLCPMGRKRRPRRSETAQRAGRRAAGARTHPGAPARALHPGAGGLAARRRGR